MSLTDTEPKKKNADLVKLGNSMYFSTATGGAYETTKKEVEPDANVLQTALLEKRRAMHWGKGLMFYKKTYDAKGNEQIEFIPDENVPQEILDFMYLNDYQNFNQGIIADFEWFSFYYVQYIKNGAGKIVEVKWQRCKDVRAEKRDPRGGEIENYYLSGLWPLPNEGYYTKIPAFNRLTGSYGIYKHQLVSIDKDYYPQPAWHSITKWLYISSKIPRWILANIDNSINLKYHVKIPLQYILDMCPIAWLGDYDHPQRDQGRGMAARVWHSFDGNNLRAWSDAVDRRPGAAQWPRQW